ncbi:MAG: twin-arginine translocase subunit TatC [Candidatus Saccharimonas sp.]
MGHVRELRRRLFWTALWFVILSGIAFPFYHQLIHVLMVPLGDEKLYFLSPIGGLSFAMKICMYVGMVATLPILVYNLYKFIAPAVRKHSARKAIGYAALSMLLAALGVLFAYYVSLPSAIYFLTHFDLGDISAMLTVDAYLSFIVSYVLAGAMLFQLPLIMMIVDNITPTPPSVWNKYQRHMVVASLVIAMLITPVPDILNQFILAAPIVLMYQFGVMMVWMRHRKLKRVQAKAVIKTKDIVKPLQKAPQALANAVVSTDALPQSTMIPTVVAAKIEQDAEPSATLPLPARPRRSIDGVVRRSPVQRPAAMPVVVPQRPVPQASTTPAQQLRLATTIDGFFPARPREI